MILHPKDIKLVNVENNTMLFLHAPTLQVYTITDLELLGFLSYYHENGRKQSLEYFGKEKYHYYYSEIADVIRVSPKLSTIDISDIQDEIGCFDTIVLPISAHCTLKCPYCFAQTNGKFNFRDYSNEQAEKVIDFTLNNRMSRKSKEPLCITFFGGEPLMRIDIIKHVIEYMKTQYPNEMVTYSITTNGTILNDDVIAVLRDNHFSVLVSIDGPDNEYNLRVDHYGNKSFSKVMEFIDKLKKNNVYVELRATLVNSNPYILETFDFFEKMRTTFYVAFAYSSENRNHKYSNYDSDTLQLIKKQFEKLAMYYLKKMRNGEKIFNKQFYTYNDILRYRRNNQIPCGAARSYFSITSDGTIFSCTHFINSKEHSIGNITDGINDRNKYVPLEIEKIAECKDCWARYLCLGHCTAQKISMGKSNATACHPNECELEKIQMELYLKLYYYAKTYTPKIFEEKAE